jgi:hypothetical protein
VRGLGWIGRGHGGGSGRGFGVVGFGFCGRGGGGGLAAPPRGKLCSCGSESSDGGREKWVRELTEI